MTFLKLQAIGKSFDGHEVLRGIDLEVAAGSRTVIVGPSASGKTTLLRIIAGFESPDHGIVSLDGRVLADGTNTIPAYRRGVGYVAQDGALFPHLTVEQNIAFGLTLTGHARQTRIVELLDTVELDASLLPRRPDQLSGGQQQRVAIARTLAQQPRLILLDEPFSALDTGLRESTRKAVGRILSAADMTTILVTHDQEEALKFADEVAILDQGKLAQVGSPRALYTNPESIFVAKFLGDAIVLDATVRDGVATCAFGRVHVRASGEHGPVKLLLRPEQITLVEVPSGKTADDACYGRVAEIDYAGAYQTMTVSPPSVGSASTDQSITVRTSSRFTSGIGALVRLDIAGDALIFPTSIGDDV